MRALRDLSIKRKLTLITMITSSAALLLACATFVLYDRITFREALARKLAGLADIIAANCTAALAFNDARAAEEILAALRAEPAIVAARIYAGNGRVFATYSRGAASAGSLPNKLIEEPEPDGGRTSGATAPGSG